MKYLFVLLLAVVTLTIGQSQSASVKSSDFTEKAGGFNITDIPTSLTFMGKPVVKTASGSQFVYNEKKTGAGTYRLWIGDSTGESFTAGDGNTYDIRVFKSGSYAFFKKAPDGNRLVKVSLTSNKPQ